MRKYLASANDHPQLGRVAPEVSKSELHLPREKRRTLAQLRARKCPLLRQYLHSIGAEDSPNCPLCTEAEHNTVHLFNCERVQTELTPEDLWRRPAEAAALVDEWVERLEEPEGRDDEA